MNRNKTNFMFKLISIQKGCLKMKIPGKYFNHRNLTYDDKKAIDNLSYPYNLIIEMALYESEEIVPLDIILIITKEAPSWPVSRPRKEIELYERLLEKNISGLTNSYQNALYNAYKRGYSIERETYQYNYKKRLDPDKEVLNQQTLVKAFKELMCNKIRFAHFYMLENITGGYTSKKYHIMFQYGRMPYFSDIEKYFSDMIKKHAYKDDVTWFGENVFLRSVGTYGMVKTLENLYDENKQLKAENEKLKEENIHLIKDNVSTKNEPSLYTIPDTLIMETQLPKKLKHALYSASIRTLRDVVESFRNGNIYNISRIGTKSVLLLKNYLKEEIGISIETGVSIDEAMPSEESNA